MKIILPWVDVPTTAAGAFTTLMQGGTAKLCTVAPTINGSGQLVGETPSANFPVSSALTWVTGGAANAPQTSSVAAAVSFLLGTPPSVAETIVGVLLTSTAPVKVLFVQFDKPITVGAGYGYANVALRLAEVWNNLSNLFSDQSSVAFLQV